MKRNDFYEKYLKKRGESKMLLKAKLKKDKGITLLALVVTIIIIIILSTITISMVTGENRDNEKCN